ncbi:MAG: hypothetical protein LBS06_05975 [Treponema sp.]|jgi:hypothetical protein|nr:hypothetical protein [Treponema sp.]
MKISGKWLLSAPYRLPAGIFVIYMVGASLAILGFRFIFPGEAPPIPYFSRNWRLVQGVLDIFTLFPALAMSALVIPFALEAGSSDARGSFSPKFFQHIRQPVITGIAAAVINGLVCLLLFPLAHDREADMRFRGSLYRLAREKAGEARTAGRWTEAARFVAICEGIWPESPEMEALRTETAIRLEEYRFETTENTRGQDEGVRRDTALRGIPGRKEPPNVTEALSMAKTAMGQERYFDAHWFATLAGRLAKPGSPEEADASRVASRAWNMVESLAPGAREERLYSIYRLKRSGYEAMVAEDWIRAFYIFQDLLKLSPDDPDAAAYLQKSREGTGEIAFFIDDMETALGDTLTWAVFSLPAAGQGREVLRFSSLSCFADYAYGLDLEYLRFDAGGRLTARVEAPYIKLLPLRVETKPRLLILMRALDRYDRDRRWEPEWLQGEAAGPDSTQIVLDPSYEDFLLLSQVRRRLDDLPVTRLFTAARKLGASGYIPQVFEAEIVSRLSAPLYFLPMTIAAVIIGWRFRAKKRPRYLFVPMLFMLPLVFNGLNHLVRFLLNILGIQAVIAFGLSTAIGIFVAGMALAFILSLIILAAQHG